jgi:hypothetical protein
MNHRYRKIFLHYWLALALLGACGAAPQVSGSAIATTSAAAPVPTRLSQPGPLSL